jgi:hypothetical protein
MSARYSGGGSAEECLIFHVKGLVIRSCRDGSGVLPGAAEGLERLLLPEGVEDLRGRGDALTEKAAAERLGGRGGAGPAAWRRNWFCSGVLEVEEEVEARRGRGGGGHGGREENGDTIARDG